MIFPLPAHWLPRLRTLGARLIKPSPSIIDPQERRNARLLAALLTLTLAILLFGRMVRLVVDFKEPPIQAAAVWFNILALAVAYSLSRTRYHRVGAIATVIVVSVIIYLQTMYRGYNSPGDVSNPAAWLVALLLLSSFVISWRATLTLSVANLAGLWMLPRIIPGITYFDIRFSFELVFALSLVIALVAYLRRRDWSLIHAQTEALTESENRYRTLFSASFEGIVVHDDGVVIEVNDTLQNMLGYSKEEMIGAQVLTFIPPEWQTTIFEKARENILLYEIQGQRKDGTRFDMEVSVKRIMYKGRLLRVVAMRDITERKRVENERIQLITETERSRVLRQFISDASHDLRQPLATMNTSLYLLRRKSNDLGEAAIHVDTLDGQLAHLTRLLEDLFAMSRLDEPELYMERAPLDLNQLVMRVVQELVPIAVQKKQQLRFDAKVLPSVLADQVDLRRAITHLVTNALSYTQAGGQITVRTILENQKVIVEVQDTGIGIDPDDLPHIFERFYRADLARQTETGGSGLGLAIVQKIIENHSGTIDVESHLGAGSTFRISLPLPSQSLAV
jgi:PAS domain S-box-containing protein